MHDNETFSNNYYAPTAVEAEKRFSLIISYIIILHSR